MNMAILMTADLLRALSPAVAARLWTCAYLSGTESEGISREAAEKKAMRECDIDWCALARDQATRKYGERLLPTVFFRKKVKIQRFLLYRGYLMEDIGDIWRNFAD